MEQPLIKLFLLVGIGLVAVVAFRGRATALNRALWRLSGLLALAGGALAVLFPEWVSRLADFVGVGRGVDLVLYVLVVVFLLISVILFRRTTELEDRVARLVRALALHEAEGHDTDRGGRGE